jgi:hypothetical protein
MDRKHQNAAVKRNGSKTQTTPARPNRDPLEAAMQRAVDRVRSMSQKERVQSLIDAGILTAKGKLAAAYR